MDRKKQEFTNPAPRQRSGKKNDPRLLNEFISLWAMCRGAFVQNRTWERAQDLALAMVASLGKQTISGLICTKGHQYRDWTADYRVFSKSKWDPDLLFDVAMKESLNHLKPGRPFVVAMDDTRIKKTGKKIPSTQYTRDPMSPPFHVNFIRAHRFIQVSALIPESSGVSAARAVPIKFENIPPVPKPGYKATEAQITQYKQRKRKENLSFHGVHQLNKIRNQLDSHDASRQLVALVDGSFCNSTVLKNLPAQTTLIGRIRGDAKLHDRPNNQSPLGRTRRYGESFIRPEEIRVDDQPWEKVSAFAAGKHHMFRVKCHRNLLWRKAGHEMPLTLLVIAPLAYRKTKSGQTLYRRPAYLICTDPGLSVRDILQYYVWRWDIEVNFRDEKQLMGVGKAQLRNIQSVSRAPAFSVCVYSLLLLAGLRVERDGHSNPAIPTPKWYKSEKIRRVTTNQLQNSMRRDLWSQPLIKHPDHFSGFIDKTKRHTKSKKLLIPYKNAVFCIYN